MPQIATALNRSPLDIVETASFYHFFHSKPSGRHRFRFEKFVQGHPFWEAPMLMPRICGICFVSHHLCGAKALDDMIGVGANSGIRLTHTAEKIRRLGHYAQMLQSHATA